MDIETANKTEHERELSKTGVSSYGKVWSFEDATIFRQFHGLTVEIEEKIDGSQFSVYKDDHGNLFTRSKNVSVYALDAGMFDMAVEAVQRLAHIFENGKIYRFEYLRENKHNSLHYEKVPPNNLVLFDVEDFKTYEHAHREELQVYANKLGVLVVPTLYTGPLPDLDTLQKMIETTESFLGGCIIEGIVIKARDFRHNKDGKMLKAKLVRADFKEKNSKNWKSTNPGRGDVIERLVGELSTEARYLKAIQALRDQGKLEGSPRDIGPVMKYMAEDLSDEHAEYVKEELFRYFWKKIVGRANSGFPQWYKNKLMEELKQDDFATGSD